MMIILIRELLEGTWLNLRDKHATATDEDLEILSWSCLQKSHQHLKQISSESMEAVEFQVSGVIGLIGCRSFPGVSRVSQEFPGSSRKIRQSRVVMSATGFSVQWVWRSEICDMRMWKWWKWWLLRSDVMTFLISLMFFPNFLWVFHQNFFWPCWYPYPRYLVVWRTTAPEKNRGSHDRILSASPPESTRISQSQILLGGLDESWHVLSDQVMEKLNDKMKKPGDLLLFMMSGSDCYVGYVKMLRSALYLFKWSLVKATSTHNTKVHTSPEYSARFAISSS